MTELKQVMDALVNIEAKIRQKKGFYSISVGHDEVKKAHKAGILKGLDVVHEEIKAMLAAAPHPHTVDVEKLKREVALNLVVKFARDWEVGIHGMSFQEHCLREIIDHLAARYDFVEKK